MARRPVDDTRQEDLFGTHFRVRAPRAVAVADFDGGLRRAISDALYEARMVRGKTRSQVAAEMADWLGNPKFSEFMLNQYSSEANETHNISVKTLKALVKATGCLWLWDVLVKDDGCVVLCGDEARSAELGHLERQIQAMQRRAKTLKAQVPVSVAKGRRS